MSSKQSVLAAILRCPEPEATRRLVVRLSDARYRTELRLVTDEWIDCYAATCKITPWSRICSDPNLITSEDLKFYVRLFLTTTSSLLPEISEMAGKDYTDQGKFYEQVSKESGLKHGPDNETKLIRYIVYLIITLMCMGLDDKSGATTKRLAETATETPGDGTWAVLG